MICGELRAKNRRKSGENCGVTKRGVHDVIALLLEAPGADGHLDKRLRF